MGTVRIGGIAAAPGETKFGRLGKLELPDGTEISVPLIVANGQHEGPKLLLTAAVHGTEITGSEVIRRLTRELLDLRQLRGTIVALPIVNPLAFHQSMMNTPQDLFNLNRTFPGVERSLTSFRLAHLVTNEALAKCDYLIDFHANPSPAMCFAIVKSVSERVDKPSEDMARAFGITTIWMKKEHEHHRTGTINETAGELGKPSITVELIYWRRIEEKGVQVGIRGTLNVMKRLEMIDGAIEKQPGYESLNQEGLTRIELTANRGGFVHTLKVPGEPMAKGDKIALIRNPYGDVVEEIVTPVSGFVLAYPLLGNQAVSTGESVAFVATKG